jgi:hypothetical protein
VRSLDRFAGRASTATTIGAAAAAFASTFDEREHEVRETAQQIFLSWNKRPPLPGGFTLVSHGRKAARFLQ